MSEPQYGQYGAPGPGPAPDNMLVWAILATVLCCMPLGIPSIIKAARVNILWETGQFERAQQAAQEAKKFAIWAALAWLVLIVLYALFFVFIGINAANSGQLPY